MQPLLLLFRQLFEGTKAYRGADNKVRLFRPDLNMKRMNMTAERSMLPVSWCDVIIGEPHNQAAQKYQLRDA